jgi:hypothetical protein
MIFSNLEEIKSNIQSHDALGTTELPSVFDIFQVIVFSYVECKQAYRWNKGKEMQVAIIKCLTHNALNTRRQ